MGEESGLPEMGGEEGSAAGQGYTGVRPPPSHVCGVGGDSFGQEVVKSWKRGEARGSSLAECPERQ